MVGNVTALLGQLVRRGLVLSVWAISIALAPITAMSAPYADMIIDARTGEILQSTNADTRLHPASLTKMMTLYIAFEAVERGEITLDTRVTVGKHAAAEPPSKVGLKPGQKIAFRYLIRAAAIKSANDAATAIGESLEGSEAAFARRMNRTAKALGMTRTTFKNAHGLTESGHMSTARDMTTLGRRLFYDFPQYYNLFSRRTADAGVRQVNNTNRRFLNAYKGADGIKTGFTNAAGFNLVASAERGKKRIIATVFGGKSTAQRNARMAELMDTGFGLAPNRAKTIKPTAPQYLAEERDGPRAVGKRIRVSGVVTRSPRPLPRPSRAAPAAAPPEDMLLAMQSDINSILAEVAEPPKPEGPTLVQETAPQPETLALAEAMTTPEAAPETPAEAVEMPAEPKETVVAEVTDQPEPAPEPPAVLAIAAAKNAPPARPARAKPAPEPKVQVARAQPPRLDPKPLALTSATPSQPRMTASDVAAPPPRPADIVLAAVTPTEPIMPEQEIVTRVSTSGGRHHAIHIGRYGSRYQAERMLLTTALAEMDTLNDGLRKVVKRKGGYEANFVGLSEQTASLACKRLISRGTSCTVIAP